MARLQVVLSNRVVETHEVGDGVVIGRSTEAHVLVPDPSVSRRHAAVAPDGPRFIIEDLASANGVRVNGKAVQRASLVEGDRIQLGDIVLVFTRDADAPAADASAEAETPDAIRALAGHAARDLSISVPSTWDAVDALGETLSDLSASVGLPDDARRYLHLATLEAVANAHRHGNREDGTKRVRCRLRREARRVVLRVRDDGPGFDFRQALTVAREGDARQIGHARAAEGRPGGLGIMMMVRCLDLVEFADGGREVVLTKCAPELLGMETIIGTHGFAPEAPPPDELVAARVRASTRRH